MEIHVINLDRDVEKWKLFNQQIKSDDLKFTRFKAIDGNHRLDTIKVSKMCDDLICNTGVIGCAQSHISLWKQLVNSNQPYFIIFEDDAKFNVKELTKVLESVDKFIKENKGDFIISLMCIGPFCNVGDKTNIGKYTAISSIFPLCTTAYIITKGAAEYLLSVMNNTVSYHIDFEIAKHVLLNDKIKYLVITSNIVTTQEVESSIGSCKKNSIVFGWSKRMMWYCNIPLWKYGNLYFTFLLLLLILLTIIFTCRRKIIYIFCIIFILLELLIFSLT